MLPLCDDAYEYTDAVLMFYEIYDDVRSLFKQAMNHVRRHGRSRRVENGALKVPQRKKDCSANGELLTLRHQFSSPRIRTRMTVQCLGTPRHDALVLENKLRRRSWCWWDVRVWCVRPRLSESADALRRENGHKGSQGSWLGDRPHGWSTSSATSVIYRRYTSRHLRHPENWPQRLRADVRHKVGREHHRDADAAIWRAIAKCVLPCSSGKLMSSNKTAGRPVLRRFSHQVPRITPNWEVWWLDIWNKRFERNMYLLAIDMVTNLIQLILQSKERGKEKEIAINAMFLRQACSFNHDPMWKVKSIKRQKSQTPSRRKSSDTDDSKRKLSDTDGTQRRTSPSGATETPLRLQKKNRERVTKERHDTSTTRKVCATKGKKVCSIIPKTKIKAILNGQGHHPSRSPITPQFAGGDPTQEAGRDSMQSVFFKESARRSRSTSSEYRRTTSSSSRSKQKIRPEESCVHHTWTESAEDTKNSLQHFLPPSKQPGIVHTKSSQKFSRACDKFTPHRSDTYAMAEKTVRAVKKKEQHQSWSNPASQTVGEAKPWNVIADGEVV